MRGKRGRDQEPHDPWGKRAHARSRKSQRGYERLRVQRGRYAVLEPAPNQGVQPTAYSLCSCVAPASGSG
jgi:hypothetical protein